MFVKYFKFIYRKVIIDIENIIFAKWCYLDDFVGSVSSKLGMQGWQRSGESAHLSVLWSGFDSQTWRHRWIEFVVDSRFSPRVFLWIRTPVLLPPQIPTLQIPIRSGNEGHRFASFAVQYQYHYY